MSCPVTRTRLLVHPGAWPRPDRSSVLQAVAEKWVAVREKQYHNLLQVMALQMGRGCMCAFLCGGESGRLLHAFVRARVCVCACACMCVCACVCARALMCTHLSDVEVDRMQYAPLSKEQLLFG